MQVKDDCICNRCLSLLVRSLVPKVLGLVVGSLDVLKLQVKSSDIDLWCVGIMPPARDHAFCLGVWTLVLMMQPSWSGAGDLLPQGVPSLVTARTFCRFTLKPLQDCSIHSHYTWPLTPGSTVGVWTILSWVLSCVFWSVRCVWSPLCCLLPWPLLVGAVAGLPWYLFDSRLTHGQCRDGSWLVVSGWAHTDWSSSVFGLQTWLVGQGFKVGRWLTTCHIRKNNRSQAGALFS